MPGYFFFFNEKTFSQRKKCKNAKRRQKKREMIHFTVNRQQTEVHLTKIKINSHQFVVMYVFIAMDALLRLRLRLWLSSFNVGIQIELINFKRNMIAQKY